jgi:hypothetical protein
MNVISVCKNVIAGNNKRGWVDPEPAVRIARNKSGSATDRAHSVAIVDKDGNVVAKILSSTDGKPVVKCGAKVAIVTEYDVVKLDV